MTPSYPWRFAFAAAALAGATCTAVAADPFTLSFLGQQTIATGTQFAGTTVGGLSGIDYDAATQSYWVISDDRSQVTEARFYTVKLDLARFNKNANPGMAGVQFTGVTTLRDVNGAAFGAGLVDPESIRKVGERLIWTSEGDRFGTNLQAPFVREARLDGTHVSSYATPSHYGTTDPAMGVRRNLAFESLAVGNDGRTVYTATENALLQDGPAADVGVATRCRVLAFDRERGAAVAEYLYLTDPVAAESIPAGRFATNGLVELLAVPGGEGRFIAVERSFSTGVGTSIRLYLASVAGAANILGERTAPAGAGAMQKQLLFDLGTLGIALDNIEGITWGPLVNGRRSLVLVADNNFSATQVTQFLAFEVTAGF
ncbi:MAG: esterase-like activity of phytase family protein [Rhizobiales bacterium]|nr:esterase-like activity of phytase family protein [Rhizobacter sp.]